MRQNDFIERNSGNVVGKRVRVSMFDDDYQDYKKNIYTVEKIVMIRTPNGPGPHRKAIKLRSEVGLFVLLPSSYYVMPVEDDSIDNTIDNILNETYNLGG